MAAYLAYERFSIVTLQTIFEQKFNGLKIEIWG